MQLGKSNANEGICAELDFAKVMARELSFVSTF